MTAEPLPPRPRPRSVRSGAFFFLLPLLAAAPAVAGAQDVPPPDTAAAEPVRADTAAQDTLPPPPTLPELDPVGPTGWEAGVWEWDRSALLMLPDASLLDLLERVPGITPVRVGIAGQPEGAAVLGTAAGGIRYIVDGFELDPLTTPTFDASRLSLLALARVRVERGLNGAVVRIETMSPGDARAQSVVEAATGDIGVNVFRGIFMAPRVLGGPLALGFERLAAESVGGSNRTIGWLKWTFVRDSAGVQAEYRQSEIDRSGLGDGFLGQRSDLALRARGRLLGITAEAYAGASAVEDDDGVLAVREGSPQAGLRVHRSFAGPLPSGARAAVRFRDHPRLPGTEASVELWSAPLPGVGVGVDAVRGWWEQGDPTGHVTARGRLGPVWGLSAFGQATFGDDPAIRLVAPPDSVVLAASREGVRLGASFDRWGIHLGAAAVRLRADTVAGFGVGFDPLAPRFEGGEATGIEALVSLPTGWAPLRVEGWYLGMDAPATWLYLPDLQWRAALVYHHLPLPSGNLEIRARAEHVYRGRMATPCTPVLNCEELAPVDGLVSIASYRATNIELTIRVLTVRAFLRWENAFHRRFQQDLPFGFPAPEGNPARVSLPGQHFLYGVKWEFWN